MRPAPSYLENCELRLVDEHGKRDILVVVFCCRHSVKKEPEEVIGSGTTTVFSRVSIVCISQSEAGIGVPVDGGRSPVCQNFDVQCSSVFENSASFQLPSTQTDANDFRLQEQCQSSSAASGYPWKRCLTR